MAEVPYQQPFVTSSVAGGMDFAVTNLVSYLCFPSISSVDERSRSHDDATRTDSRDCPARLAPAADLESSPRTAPPGLTAGASRLT